MTPVQIHKKLAQRRQRACKPVMSLGNVRYFLKGKTHRASANEKRGRPPTLIRADVLAMNRTRLALIKSVGQEREVHWEEVIEKSGVPPCDETTAAKSFAREGIPVRWRRPREKPQRTAEHVQERYDTTSKWRFLRKEYFRDSVDLLMDNKQWDAPTTERARKHLKRQKIKGHLRTPEEGLQPAFTKPNRKRHRINPGGALHVCAGISNSKVVLWEYIHGRWNGQRAADLYKGAVHTALAKHRGEKRTYKVLEDNDPAGYKSGKAVRAKKEMGIQTLDWPRYSPDLNPLDFFLWDDIGRRMDLNAPEGRESIADFKARLRRTAMRTRKAEIEKAVLGMKRRIQAIYDAGGNDIDID